MAVMQQLKKAPPQVFVEVGVKAKPLQVRVLQSRDEFYALEADWESLRHRCGERLDGHSVSHGWLSSCLQHFSPQQCLVILISDASGALLAAAPLQVMRTPGGVFRRALRRVQFIGATPAVYECMDVLVDPSLPMETAMGLIAEALQAHRSVWDMLDLRFWRDEAQGRLLLEALSLESGQLLPDMPIPYLPLQPTVEAFAREGGKKKQRQNLRTLHNTLAREFPDDVPQLVFAPPGPALSRHWQDFVRRHIAYWAARGVRSDFVRYPALCGFYEALLSRQAPGVAYSRLMLGEQTLADGLVIRQASGLLIHLCLFNEQFARYRPSKLHMEALMHEAIRGGLPIFSFGRGAEEYKSHWTDQQQPLWSLLGFKNRLAAACWQVDALLARGRDWLKR